MKKKSVGGSRIFALWEKASKANKTDETSTPNQSVVASSSSPVEPENNLQLVLVQATHPEPEPESRGATSTPIVQDDEAIDEEDEQMQAIDEVNTELLSCMAAFSPLRSFAAYNQEKLVKLATKFYANDFITNELARLPWQLEMYITNVRRDERFKNLKSICKLSVMLVETNKHEQYFAVYKLLKLVLILPVATAQVERVFSSMSYLKNKLRNKMGDEYLNNCMVTFVERKLFNQVSDEDVINLFQQGDRRVTGRL